MTVILRCALFLLVLEVELQCILGIYYSGYNNIIDVNVNGNDTAACCVEGNCSCSSLATALQNVSRNNTLISISSSKIVLLASANISGRISIGIIGNNNTVIDCNDTGSMVLLLHCANINISGITWNRCGDNSAAVLIKDSFDVSINNCKFQNSSTFGINISATVGYIIIANSVFINNSRIATHGAGGLIILPLEQHLNANTSVTIINCSFLFNGYNSSPYGGGVSITNINSSSVHVLIENSVFLHNFAYYQGAVYIYGITRIILLQISNVTFKDNSEYALFCHIITAEENNASFTISNSTIRNSVSIESNSLHASLFISGSSFGSFDRKLVFELHFNSSYLRVNITNNKLLYTQISIYVRRYQYLSMYQDGSIDDYYVLSFEDLTGNNTSLQIDGSESNGFQCYIMNCIFSSHSSNSSVLDIVNVNYLYIVSVIQINNSKFIGNSKGSGVVRLAYVYNSGYLGNVQLSDTNFTENLDNENTLYIYYSNLFIYNKVVFQDNAATKGAGIYFTQNSSAVLYDHVEMTFINNVAALSGGAIFADYPSSSSTCPPWVLFYTNGKHSVEFKNNYANSAGNSIYFNIPGECDIETNLSSENSIMYVPKKFTYTGSSYKEQISTSPYGMTLGLPAVVDKTSKFSWIFSIKNIMLGEALLDKAKMLDYFNNTAEQVLFHVKCLECMDYKVNSISSSFIYVGASQSISIVGKKVKNESTLMLQLSSIKGTITNDVQSMHMLIELSLSRCKLGYEYNSTTGVCTCFSYYDIVSCSKDGIEIKKGFWLGTVNNHRAVGICPKDYCSYNSCPIKNEFCNLTSPSSICASHRDGPACGKCEMHYILPFDSNDCIHNKNCHLWQSFLVVIVTMLYWIVVIFTIRLVMYFVKIEAITGYVYGIIFFYSILDLLIDKNLIVSEGLIDFVSVISALFNLSPIFIGKLCLSDKIEGIDQQFIHYIHPLAIVLLLLMIAALANRSVKVTAFLGRVGMIRSICLLLLLFYTSLSSTSWKLLRPLTFSGDSGVYTYSSPSIHYFSGRHIAYGIVAVVCVVIIVIGLPALLLLEPFLRRRFTFIRWKPLLDQFQGCYKNKYHCFAANYLICRQLIFAILCLYTLTPTDRYLLLQMLCLIILMVHVWIQPYKDACLNSLDASTLVSMLIIISLNIETQSTTLHDSTWGNDLVISILVLFPLITFIGYLLYSSCVCESTLFQRSRRARGYVTLPRLVLLS